MPEPKQGNEVLPFDIGDRVKIKHYQGGIARIVEFRGPLGPGGALIFRVRVPLKPTAVYIEVRADQLEPAPPIGTTNGVKGRKVEPKSPKAR